MQKKYSSLRIIASVINVISWLMLLLTFMEAFFLIALTKGIDEFTDEMPKLFYFIKALNAGLGLNAIFILITGLISFVLLNSVSERIRLFIDIEKNTRTINNNLNKITQLLEEKFELKTNEIKEEESLIDKINYWGQVAPIVISFLFFIYILKQLPSGSEVDSKNTTQESRQENNEQNSQVIEKKVTFVNETDNRVYIAIAFYDNNLNDWNSKGWFEIKPFENFDYTLPEYFSGNEIFFFGDKFDENNSVEASYSGLDGYFCIQYGDGFDYLESNCQNKQRKGFRKIPLIDNKGVYNLIE